jgi:hypothetical protein
LRFRVEVSGFIAKASAFKIERVNGLGFSVKGSYQTRVEGVGSWLNASGFRM